MNNPCPSLNTTMHCTDAVLLQHCTETPLCTAVLSEQYSLHKVECCSEKYTVQSNCIAQSTLYGYAQCTLYRTYTVPKAHRNTSHPHSIQQNIATPSAVHQDWFWISIKPHCHPIHAPLGSKSAALSNNWITNHFVLHLPVFALHWT